MVNITYKVIIYNAVNTFSSEPFNYEMNNVINFTTVEDVNSLTDTAEVVVSKAGYALNGLELLGRSTDNDKSVEFSIIKGTRITIDAGYEGILYRIFDGYIVNFQMDDSGYLVLKCEDEMYKLKTGRSLINSFPSPLVDSVIDINNAKKFSGQDFKLHHLLYWIFLNIGTPSYEIYCNNLEIGKLRLKNRFNVATILKLMKDRFGMYIYFKNIFIDRNNSIGQTNIPTKRLYVGWKYWHKRAGIKINDLLTTEVEVPSEEIVDDKAYKIKYASPIDSSLYGEYNRIIADDMVWKDTGKKNLIVVVKSIQSDNSVLKASYPLSITDLEKEQALQALPDNATDTEIQNFISENAQTADSFNDFISLEAEDSNIINLEIPDLNQSASNALAAKTYSEYEDDGFIGDIITFGGYPLTNFVTKGDVITYRVNKTGFIDVENIVEYSYYVDKVVREFNQDGYRQTIFNGSRYYDINIEGNVSTLINLE